jgi:hypothetical protein
LFHDHTQPSHRPDRCRGRRRCDAAPALSSPTHAAAPLTGQQAPGWYRYKVGSIEVTVATDGVNRFKFPDTFVLNQGRDQINAATRSMPRWRPLICSRRPTWSRSRIVRAPSTPVRGWS